MADQLDLKLVLEANGVADAGQVCQQLSEHGVTTLQHFATLSKESLLEWAIYDRYAYVRDHALPHARKLLASREDLFTIKQQLLVRACIHYM